MKRGIALILLTAVTLAGACRPTNDKGRTGKPDPAFQGEAPEDAYVDDCEPGSYGGTLILATPTQPPSFNVVIATSTASTWVLHDVVYKALTAYDNKEQKDLPGLAKSWESSADGRIWTLHLRKGVRWSDGEPFDADDVLFTFQVTFDPRIPAESRDSFTQSDGSLPELEKVDDYTVKFLLKEPNAYFIPALNDAYLIPKHKWQSAYEAGNFSHSILLSADPTDVVGLGPYRVASFTPDQRIVLERNPYYWKIDKKHQRLPYIDRVMFLIVPNNNTWALKLQNGEIDMHQQIQPTTVDQIKVDEKKGDYTVYDTGTGFAPIFLVLNQDTGKNKEGKPRVDPVKLKWFREVKFRQAVSYAIDREAIVRTIFNGRAVPTYGFESPANKVWYSDDIQKYPYDPGKARALLAEIGIMDRNGDGIAEDPEGHPIKFSLMTNSNNEVRVNSGVIIKDNLSKIGFEVDFKSVDLSLFANVLGETRAFDAAIGNWQPALPPDPVGAKDVLSTRGPFHYSFPNQKEPSTEWEKRIDDLLARCSSTYDLAERQQYYREVQSLWSEYLPEIDLCVPNYFVAARNRFGNFKPSPLPNFAYWNIDQLYFTK